jgi:hypothetical protein
MEYGYKPTTHGRTLLAACAALEKPLTLTRVAIGSGVVPEGTNLADVHELVSYVADGAIGERFHQDDRLHLTIQYDNSSHPDLKTFFLSEFIVYATDPETGEETDLLYATLGDYRQPVPAYNDAYPASIFNFPLVLIISDEIDVKITATPGIVSYDDLMQAVEDHSISKTAHQDIRKEVSDLKETVGDATEALDKMQTAMDEIEQDISGLDDREMVTVSKTPPSKGPTFWFCSDKNWKPSDDDDDAVVATAELGDPEDADEAPATAEINGVEYPIPDTEVTEEEDGQVVATIQGA